MIPSLREVQLRHAKYYARVLNTAKQLYKQGGEALNRALDLFDLEVINIKEGQAWAASRITKDADATGLCSDYADAGVNLLSLRLHPQEEAQWLEKAISAARHISNRDAEGAHLTNLGHCYFRLGNMIQAMKLFNRHIQIARLVYDDRGMAAAIGGLAQFNQAIGK